ncbi:CHASE domain-containing protein [Horticoccus sp. 23ND18S-11]|uniref:CHASE domain-containing protein n=1 Tax=Horticoccus sp. 23ND18S-11 TaxID=3391832 RepID=UPI0039C99420
MSVPAKSPLLTYRGVVVAVLALGVAVSVAAYVLGRREERSQAVAEFLHRAELRHSLTREVLGRYADALFGLSALFTIEAGVTREEFARAADRLEGRIAGVQAFEWVPVVKQEQRADVERELGRNHGPAMAQFIEYGADGTARRAETRPQYYPIVYVHPLPGNEAAVGYDLMTGPTRATLERARESRRMTLTHRFRLVQEKGDHAGVVMVQPVFRGAGDGELAGFLQCVFRVHDLLETAQSRQPDTNFDLLYVDASETDPARRVLHYRPSREATVRTSPTEAEFREGVVSEHRLPFGQRDWRLLFRPRAGWLESRYTSMPLLRSCSLLLLAGLVAGLVRMTGRRTATIRQEVTERTRELAESRRQLANMLHALPGMSYRCTYDGQLTVLFLSSGARELTGWTAEEFLSGTVHFRDCIHPADLDRVREVTRKALEGRTDVEVEYRVRTRAGEEKWVLSRGRGVYSTDGALSFFEGLAIDITAQKRAEAGRLELERKLLEGQKLESLGLLAGGIAHDFNNLLSSILGNATMARLSLTPDSPVEGQLRSIESASLRAAELCRQMLAYAGKGRFVVEPTDLTELTDDLLPLLKISIAHQATLRLDLVRGLPPVLADATQIRQIVMNLVLNAADAMTGRTGEIVVSTGVTHVDAATLAGGAAGAGLPAGEFVFLEVKDAGTGMTPAVMAKIFDPFFTTKFAGRGLGLAAVLGIVRGHSGALLVSSTPDVGTAFRLLLPPLRVKLPAAKRNGDAATREWKPSGNLLVVDDEEQVRAVMVAMLKASGFSATAVADGESAVQLFREKPDHFDAVVLDLLMPGLNGEQTCMALREIRPDVRVLLASGYSEGNILGRLGGGRALGFLAKPFTRDALQRKLRDLLE